MNPSDFNGKVVRISAKKLAKTLQTHISYGEGSHVSKAVGISFATTSDCREKAFNGYPYVHVLYKNKNGYWFYRFPIMCLKIVKCKIPYTLKCKALNKIKEYYKLHYFDNLSYVEALSNIMTMKTK